MKNCPRYSRYRPGRHPKTPLRLRVWYHERIGWHGQVTRKGPQWCILYTARGASDTDVHRQLKQWLSEHHACTEGA